MVNANSSDDIVFWKRNTTVLKHTLYGVALTVLIVVLFVYRDTVATELGPTLANVPFVSVSLGELLLEWTMVALLVLGGPFFVASTAFMGYRYLNPVPALVVDEEGFTDNVSLTNLGRVAWTEVAGIEFGEQMGVQQLRLTFEDPDRVLQNIGGVKGAYLRFNRRMMSGHGAIPIHQLDADVGEIIIAIETHSGLSVER